MYGILVGLLAASGTGMSLFAPLAHGFLLWATIAIASAAWGLAAYMALPLTNDQGPPSYQKNSVLSLSLLPQSSLE
jgi:hypothetical protein